MQMHMTNAWVLLPLPCQATPACLPAAPGQLTRHWVLASMSCQMDPALTPVHSPLVHQPPAPTLSCLQAKDGEAGQDDAFIPLGRLLNYTKPAFYNRLRTEAEVSCNKLASNAVSRSACAEAF